MWPLQGAAACRSTARSAALRAPVWRLDLASPTTLLPAAAIEDVGGTSGLPQPLCLHGGLQAWRVAAGGQGMRLRQSTGEAHSQARKRQMYSAFAACVASA